MTPHCIIHHIAEDRTLYIEDELHLGKIRFLINRAGTIAHALIDADEVRVLCDDLAHARLLAPFTSDNTPYPWFKFADDPDGNAAHPVLIRIRRDSTTVRDLEIRLDWRSARCLALAVRDYLLAHTVATLQQRRATIPPPAAAPGPEASAPPPAPVPVAAPPAPRSRPVSEIQRTNLFDLYAALHPDESTEAGLDALFLREVGYSLEQATYDEARHLIAHLLREKRERAAAPEASYPPQEPEPVPAPSAPILPRDAAIAAGKQAVTSILAQLRPTMPRPNNKMVSSTFRALTNTIRQRGWDEPVGMHAELATLLLDHKPSPKNPLTEAEARALTAWLTSAEALPILDALWPVEELEMVNG